MYRCLGVTPWVVTLVWSACDIVGAQAPAASLPHDLYRAQMACVESAVRLGDLAEARTWLDATDSSLRGLEWRLEDSALNESLEVFPVPGPTPAILAMHPDGIRFALGRGDGLIEIRNLNGGEVVARLEGHTARITALDFRADGRQLTSGSYDRTVKIWDVETTRSVVDFRGHQFPVGGAAYSPDGKFVASCSYERPPDTVVGTVHIWNATDGTIVRTVRGGRKPLVGLRFSPDGRRIAAGSWDFCVFVWSVDGGDPVKCAVPDEGVYNAVDGLAFSPDGQLVVGAVKDNTARIWRVADGHLEQTLRGHVDAVSKVDWSPNGTRIVTGSADGSMRLFDPRTGRSLGRIDGHRDDVLDARFTPDGTRIVSSSLDATVRIWDAECPWYDGMRMDSTHAVYAGLFSPDGGRIASCSYDGRIQVWSAATLDLLTSWAAHPSDKSCHALGWTPDGRRLISGSWEPVVRVFDSVTGTEVRRFEVPSGTQDLQVSPTGRHVASANGNLVVVIDLETGERLSGCSAHSSSVLAVTFSPDGSRCVSTGRDGKAIVFEAASGATLVTMDIGGDVAEARFVAGGSQVIVARRNGHLTLHDAADGHLLRDLVRGRHGLDHFAVLPDGSRFVMASRQICIGDLTRDRILSRQRPHRSPSYRVDVDRTGTRIVSASTDKSLAILDARPLRDRLEARREALSRRARAEPFVRGGLEAEGAASFADRILQDEKLGEDRIAWIEALTLATAIPGR